MVESLGVANALALIRERTLADIDLFNDILDARDTVVLPQLKLRMAAIVCGMRSPFLDNSLERINLVRHFKEICSRAQGLAYTSVPEIRSAQSVVLLESRLAILLGLLLAEFISGGLPFDVEVEMEGSRGLHFKSRDASLYELASFLKNNAFSSSLVTVLAEAGVRCSRGEGIHLFWEGPFTGR